jgi:predicted protein tyrosine phosphatase
LTQWMLSISRIGSDGRWSTPRSRTPAGDRGPADVRRCLAVRTAGIPVDVVELACTSSERPRTRRAGAPHTLRGDRRRTYLTLNHAQLEALVPQGDRRVKRVVFVCTQNSARSQLASAVWHRRSEVPAVSAGMHPAPKVHPEAVAVARRRNVPMRPHRPRHFAEALRSTDLIISVCDRAHEELPADAWLLRKFGAPYWSCAADCALRTNCAV